MTEALRRPSSYKTFWKGVRNEVINSIPFRALVLYTDGSRSDSGRTGSGFLRKISTREHGYCFRNPDHSSVFRSELAAIRVTLNLSMEAVFT
ncbi:hypothetical protein NPIL_551541 [Nephila pilipes]|uniref:Uncharacterized protein n=1 Tax=Nephila pilipes TaxID=299642 RepID=A0A8X6QJM4_NEPPI|nr:hypothetical protein NPIL_551541 [Nephila pilipes]